MDTKEPLAEEPLPDDSTQVQPVPVPSPTATASASTTTETLTPQEMELLRHFRANSQRSTSPPKKANIDPDPALHEFLEALSTKNIELSDLDYNLQQE